MYRLYIYRLRLGPSYTRGPRPINNTYTKVQSNTHSPVIETLAMTYVETKLNLQEHQGRYPLGEVVRVPRGCRDVEDVNITDVIPEFYKTEPKPQYVCSESSNQTYSDSSW
jgi:hypothetical protein